jgi:uncharacterized zinc-type alcohol dehydrogenase-like protein
MCAGVTTYDPLKKLGVKAGDRVGIVGLGGLGVMGVKIAKAMGATVTVISRGKGKEEFARSCGADHFVDSSDLEDMAAKFGTLDCIINTVPSYHPYLAYAPLMEKSSKIGKQVLLGLHEGFVAGFAVDAMTLRVSRVMSSEVGGVRNTQEVIDLCAKHKIYPEIEIMGCDKINSIFEALDTNNDKGKRFVLDLATLKEGVVCDSPAPNLKPTTPMGLRSVVYEIVTLFFGLGWRH